MKKNWWKYLVPVILALLQIGGSIYNNYFKNEKPKDETTRFEFMIDPSKLTMDGNIFHCYDMGIADAQRFFYRLSGGKKIIKGKDYRGDTYLTIFSGGKDSLFMICLKEPTIDGIVAEITLPGKNGVKKKAVFYNRSK